MFPEELLALTDTKLKGDEEVSWCEVKGIIVAVHEIERVREDVAVVLNGVWHSAVIDDECVSFRIIWVKFKFSKVKHVW